MGKETTWGMWLTLRPRRPPDHFRTAWTASPATTRPPASGCSATRSAARRSRTSFSRELTARLILQYLDDERIWEVDPLLTYKINPLSTFFIGSTRDYRDLEPQANGTEGWRLMSRQYFVKLQ